MICFPVHCTPCLFWENTACQVGHPPVVFCTPGNRLHGSWHFNFNGLDMFCWFVDVIFSGSMSPNCFPQGSVREDRGTFELEYRQGTDRWKVAHWEGHGRSTYYLPSLHQFTSSFLLVSVLEKLWFLQVWDVTSWISFASLAAVMWLACKEEKWEFG